ncbi:MAG: AAA family ATPase [Sphaerochaetaceae bacterium]|nr:AAA family ATPase [Sphaerochaetaceae bacterium]
MSTYIHRALPIKQYLKRKSLFLLGPRQTGKSSYIKEELKEDIDLFWNLLDGRLRMRVLADPSLLSEEVAVRDLKDCLIVIDEIQKCPELLDEVHLLIEERNIRFLLTGSSARKLRTGGVNLLGGRAAQLIIHPFVYPEIHALEEYPYTLNHIFTSGLLPSMYCSDQPEIDLGDYVHVYLNEEIAAEGVTRKLPQFSRFLQIAAMTNSQMLNYTNVASDVGVSRQAVKQWYEILIDTLIGFELPPFKATKKRKAIETAKFYFFDIGVVRALRNIPTPAKGTTEFGEFFEQYIAIELRAYLDYTKNRQKLTYWRSTANQEVDFLIGTELSIEVKASSTISSKHLRGLRALREENIFSNYCIVCQEEHPRTLEGIAIYPWKYFLEQLWKGKLIK